MAVMTIMAEGNVPRTGPLDLQLLVYWSMPDRISRILQKAEPPQNPKPIRFALVFPLKVDTIIL